MANRLESVIRHLKRQLARAVRRADGVPSAFPVAKPADIRAAEAKLGVEIPPLLRRIYLEIGNGGCHLGPGFGILGLPGGYDNDGGWDIVKSSLEMAADLAWWDRSIVICDWGCSMLSCIDCSDNNFTVFRWDGNQFDAATDKDEPSDELWSVEADTFEEWLMTPNCS